MIDAGARIVVRHAAALPACAVRALEAGMPGFDDMATTLLSPRCRVP